MTDKFGKVVARHRRRRRRTTTVRGPLGKSHSPHSIHSVTLCQPTNVNMLVDVVQCVGQWRMCVVNVCDSAGVCDHDFLCVMVEVGLDSEIVTVCLCVTSSVSVSVSVNVRVCV